MSRVTQPGERVRYAEKEVRRYRDDVEEWKGLHQDLERDCWPVEDVMGKANFLFRLVLDLEGDGRQAFRADRLTSEEWASFDNLLTVLVRWWLDASLAWLVRVEEVEGEYGELDGAREFRDNIAEARGILAPDAEFFNSDALVELRDQAIDANRVGQVEPLVEP